MSTEKWVSAPFQGVLAWATGFKMHGENELKEMLRGS